MVKIPGRFARVEPPRRVRDLVLGLPSDLPRKNCWSIAEWAGAASPDGMQHLLGRATWDADRVRDDPGREEGHAHRRCPAPVHRHRRGLVHKELSELTCGTVASGL